VTIRTEHEIYHLKYESFSNCEQSYYRNIGYFEGIYTCENLTFACKLKKKDVKFVSEMVHKFLENSRYYNLYSYNKIAHTMRKIPIPGNREKK
jgi:hypothetical protein